MVGRKILEGLAEAVAHARGEDVSARDRAKPLTAQGKSPLPGQSETAPELTEAELAALDKLLVRLRQEEAHYREQDFRGENHSLCHGRVQGAEMARMVLQPRSMTMPEMIAPERLAELQRIADDVPKAEWFVATDYPALAIGAGDKGYRVVQTPNQNNCRHYGPAERWHGIPTEAEAKFIATFNPVVVGNLLALARALLERVSVTRSEG